MCGISLKSSLFGLNVKLVNCMFLIFPILQAMRIRRLDSPSKIQVRLQYEKLLYSPSSTSTTSWCWWRLRLLDNCMSHVFRRCSSCCIAVLCELHSPNTFFIQLFLVSFSYIKNCNYFAGCALIGISCIQSHRLLALGTVSTSLLEDLT